jgi:hypothetical protein
MVEEQIVLSANQRKKVLLLSAIRQLIDMTLEELSLRAHYFLTNRYDKTTSVLVDGVLSNYSVARSLAEETSQHYFFSEIEKQYLSQVVSYYDKHKDLEAGNHVSKMWHQEIAESKYITFLRNSVLS